MLHFYGYYTCMHSLNFGECQVLSRLCRKIYSNMMSYFHVPRLLSISSLHVLSHIVIFIMSLLFQVSVPLLHKMITLFSAGGLEADEWRWICWGVCTSSELTINSNVMWGEKRCVFEWSLPALDYLYHRLCILDGCQQTTWCTM